MGGFLQQNAGAIGSGAGSAVGGMIGGPPGAAIGGSLGGAASNALLGPETQNFAAQPANAADAQRSAQLQLIAALMQQIGALSASPTPPGGGGVRPNPMQPIQMES